MMSAIDPVQERKELERPTAPLLPDIAAQSGLRSAGKCLIGPEGKHGDGAMIDFAEKSRDIYAQPPGRHATPWRYCILSSPSRPKLCHMFGIVGAKVKHLQRVARCSIRGLRH